MEEFHPPPPPPPDDDTVKQINSEAKQLASKLNIADRIEGLPETDAFVTLKDHKQNFRNQPKCRLINPTKTEMGIISSKLLQRINEEIRQKTKLKQWRKTQDTIDWFKSIENKGEHEFLQCDIENFYPSISENLLSKALEYAVNLGVNVTPTEKDIILHARKTVLISDRAVWEKGNSDLFDVSMGAYDGAEVAELVGLLLLSEIEKHLPSLNFGLYRDDGLAVYKTTKGIHIERTKKALHKIFNNHDLKIEAEFRLHTEDYLDVTLDLHNNSFRPYRKPNDEPIYINKQSNHPPHIIKEIPKMITKRLSRLSSDEKAFEDSKLAYCQALKNSGHSTTEVLYKSNSNVKESIPPSTQEPNTSIHNNTFLDDIQPAPSPNTFLKTVREPEIIINEESEETAVKQVLQEEDREQDQERETHSEQEQQKGEGSEEKNNNSRKKRKRRRKIIWYNPPYNACVSTNIGKEFLKLIDKHFPPNRKDKLQKIFNRHTLKISYRTTQNMKSIINGHNSKILAEHNEQKSKKQEPTCNCRNNAKAECPLQGKCLTTSVVYKATVKTSNSTKTYIGSTEGTFKKRYYGHKSDIKNESNRNSTTLSHYIWDCKDRGEVPEIKWEVIRKCQRYKCGTRKCDVCLAEKLEILRERGDNCLNKRSELMRPCPHRRKHRLINVNDT